MAVYPPALLGVEQLSGPLTSRLFLLENETGRLTIAGTGEPAIIFDQKLLPYTASRSGGDSVFQIFPRWRRPPRKMYTGRRLYQFTLRGTYNAEIWGGINPLSDLRIAQDIGATLLLKVNQGRNAPTINLQGLTPAPFDPLPKPSSGSPIQDAILVTVTSISENPQPSSYVFNTPILTDWIINLEEDAE